jgi:hypothetical protein
MITKTLINKFTQQRNLNFCSHKFYKYSTINHIHHNLRIHRMGCKLVHMDCKLVYMDCKLVCMDYNMSLGNHHRNLNIQNHIHRMDYNSIDYDNILNDHNPFLIVKILRFLVLKLNLFFFEH